MLKSLESPKAYMRNEGHNIDSLLKPSMFESFTTHQRFITSNRDHFADRGHKQRTENMSLEKDDLRHTRRMLELAGQRSIRHGADVSGSLGVKKDVIKRL